MIQGKSFDGECVRVVEVCDGEVRGNPPLSLHYVGSLPHQDSPLFVCCT